MLRGKDMFHLSQNSCLCPGTGFQERVWDAVFALKARRASGQLQPNGAVGFGPSITPSVKLLMALSFHRKIDGSSWSSSSVAHKQAWFLRCNLYTKHFQQMKTEDFFRRGTPRIKQHHFFPIYCVTWTISSHQNRAVT